MLQCTKDMLSAKFDMTNLGKAKLVLGIEVIYDRQWGTAALHQTGHVDAILSCYSLGNCKLQYTLMTAGLSLAKLKATSRKHTALPYHQAMGSLMYLSQATWPDIVFAVAYLSKFMNGYDETHWMAVKHVIHYLKAMSTLPTIIKSDNQSAISLAQANQQAFHPQTKHINIKVAHLHEAVVAKMIMLVHCLTGQMITDMLTKALPRPKLEELKGLTNLQG
ncbi:uncharacterized protein ACA1_124810 [Acanthamoeba castellanii str. Neff]|uniref:Transposable element n=1 Tax=Acanthamoeba castellanii (strain ATCC 30010 / Neff) TaxID=1257118 RepID=L8GNT6_ACACF|nr:uncharacterized protein ACA1_124810 [Acanthamoeba castellanii str. Neff]ELR14659.1 Transposable element [Acanthamoeba castellanii str. Neff]